MSEEINFDAAETAELSDAVRVSVKKRIFSMQDGSPTWGKEPERIEQIVQCVVDDVRSQRPLGDIYRAYVIVEKIAESGRPLAISKVYAPKEGEDDGIDKLERNFSLYLAYRDVAEEGTGQLTAAGKPEPISLPPEPKQCIRFDLGKRVVRIIVETD